METKQVRFAEVLPLCLRPAGLIWLFVWCRSLRSLLRCVCQRRCRCPCQCNCLLRRARPPALLPSLEPLRRRLPSSSELQLELPVRPLRPLRPLQQLQQLHPPLLLWLGQSAEEPLAAVPEAAAAAAAEAAASPRSPLPLPMREASRTWIFRKSPTILGCRCARAFLPALALLAPVLMF
jgi:hypothetical protein